MHDPATTIHPTSTASAGTRPLPRLAAVDPAAAYAAGGSIGHRPAFAERRQQSVQQAHAWTCRLVAARCLLHATASALQVPQSPCAAPKGLRLQLLQGGAWLLCSAGCEQRAASGCRGRRWVRGCGHLRSNGALLPKKQLVGWLYARMWVMFASGAE